MKNKKSGCQNPRGIGNWIFKHEKGITDLVISAYAYEGLEYATAEFENNINLINDTNIKSTVENYINDYKDLWVGIIINKAGATRQEKKFIIKTETKEKVERRKEKLPRKKRFRYEYYFRGKSKIEQKLKRDLKTGRFISNKKNVKTKKKK